MPTMRTAWIVSVGGPAVEIFRLSPAERLRRTLSRAGCEPVMIAPPEDPPPTGAGVCLVVRDDLIADDRLIAALAEEPDSVLVSRELGPVAACVGGALAPEIARALTGGCDSVLESLKHTSPDALVPSYQPSLRKIQAPWIRQVRPEDARALEELVFDAAYKGVTDLVTKWAWPRPAAAATRWCARRDVTPNAVTFASLGLVILATGLFARGDFAAGLVAGWLMTFLDTVDGKLARVTGTSSRFGGALDHGLDLVHPPFWYLAWGLPLGMVDGALMAIIVGGYIVGRLIEGAFLAAFRCEIHSWQPLDSLFRTITARRNPNLILLSVSVLGGRPELGLTMVALWTLASLAFHGVRLLQAMNRRRRGESIVPFAAAAAERSA